MEEAHQMLMLRTEPPRENQPPPKLTGRREEGEGRVVRLWDTAD